MAALHAIVQAAVDELLSSGARWHLWPWPSASLRPGVIVRPIQAMMQPASASPGATIATASGASEDELGVLARPSTT